MVAYTNLLSWIDKELEFISCNPEIESSVSDCISTMTELKKKYEKRKKEPISQPLAMNVARVQKFTQELFCLENKLIELDFNKFNTEDRIVELKKALGLIEEEVVFINDNQGLEKYVASELSLMEDFTGKWTTIIETLDKKLIVEIKLKEMLQTEEAVTEAVKNGAHAKAQEELICNLLNFIDEDGVYFIKKHANSDLKRFAIKELEIMNELMEKWTSTLIKVRKKIKRAEEIKARRANATAKKKSITPPVKKVKKTSSESENASISDEIKD